MKLIENDVRLMRRILVALRFGKKGVASEITEYLRQVRGLNMVLPSEQTEELRERYLNRLLGKEQWLSRKYGCILLPNCNGKGLNDCIFLNSRWANPYTMYVHLVEPVPELGELGEIYWLPENNKKKYLDFAEKNHTAYLRATTVPDEPRTWLQKLWDGITING